MISAFGVEHAAFSKSFSRLAPKLRKVDAAFKRANTPNTYAQHMKENYVSWRLEGVKEAKDGARAAAQGHARNARRRRVLP